MHYSGLILSFCIGGMILAGCDSKVIEEVQDRDNSFRGNNVGGEGGPELNSNELRVVVELPRAASSDPENPVTNDLQRNLETVEPDRLEVYFVNNSLSPQGSVENVSITRQDDGSRLVVFGDGRLPLAPNVVIEASVGNQKIRALAADLDQVVYINPFSEYLLRNTVGTFTSRELDAAVECANEGTTLAGGESCLNRFTWTLLSDQIQEFEIQLPLGLDLNQAVVQLDERGDLVRFVERMKDYSLLNLSADDALVANSQDYNSVFAAFQLGKASAFNNVDAAANGRWAALVSSEQKLEDDRGQAYIYPTRSLADLGLLGITTTATSTTVPYYRFTGSFDGTDFSFSQLPLNQQAEEFGPATSGGPSNGRRLLSGRSILQTVISSTGWARSPYFMDSWLSPRPTNDGPAPQIMNGGFSAGKAYSLSGRTTSGTAFERTGLLEIYNSAMLDIGFAQSAEPEFNPSVLYNQSYNVAYVSLRFQTGSSTPAITTESGAGSWDVGEQTVIQNLVTEYVTRDTSGVTTTPGTWNNNFYLSARPSLIYSDNQSRTVNTGRLNLDVKAETGDFEIPAIGLGAAPPQGDTMAFALNTASHGKGLMLVQRQTSSGLPSAGRYRVQGLLMSMGDDVSRLRQVDNGLLEFTSTGRASMTVQALEVIHDIAAGTVSEPALTSELSYQFSVVDNGSGLTTFTEDGSSLRLVGPMRGDQEAFYLSVAEASSGSEPAGVGMLLVTRLP